MVRVTNQYRIAARALVQSLETKCLEVWCTWGTYRFKVSSRG